MTEHICGHEMCSCEECKRFYCPSCDFIFPARANSCCSDSLAEYVRRMYGRQNKKSKKSKVEIEEIASEL